jgi:hypothetical protein
MSQQKKKPLVIESSSNTSNTDDNSNSSDKLEKNSLSSLESKQSDMISTSTTSSEKKESLEESELDYDLKSQFDKLDGCKDEKYYSKDCNKFLLKKEIIESDYLSEHPDSDLYLYPNLNDKNFNIKIANKKEFYDTRYEGPDFTKSLKEQADILANADYEIQPHQAFVKNFMSFQTPYNSLLLYHGLGSGKTCSAIGVCEEMRDYMKQIGINKRIIIVASENVQDNFKSQLFDERKLK